MRACSTRLRALGMNPAALRAWIGARPIPSGPAVTPHDVRDGHTVGSQPSARRRSWLPHPHRKGARSRFGTRRGVADGSLRRDALRTSESRPNPELNLQRVTGTTLDRAVEVEDEAGNLGAAKVPGVEQVEGLQHGFDDEFARMKLSGQAQVQGRERVVFSTQVALRDRAVGIDPIL